MDDTVCMEGLFGFIDHDSSFHSLGPESESAQLPTPSTSNNDSPDIPKGHETGEAGPRTVFFNTTLNVSATFFPGASIHHLRPDLILISADNVFFYVHSKTLLNASTNSFGSLLPLSPQSYAAQIQNYHTNFSNDRGVFAGEDGQQYPVLLMPQQSSVLNVILHAIYDLACAQYAPAIDTLITAVEEMPSLGLEPKALISRDSALFRLLLSNAPLHPLPLYTLAAHFDLSDLAVPVSSHLLSFSFPELEDSAVERMGAVYLKRLFFMHLGRMEALKRILLQPPHPHAPTSFCDFRDQERMTRAWAFASACLVWDARPDMSASYLEAALNLLVESLACELCKQSLRERTGNLVVEWSIIKRTI